MTALTGAELVLALPLREKVPSGECEIDEHFGSSAIWCPDEKALALLPNFFFTFTLAMREARVDEEYIHQGLLYQYMRQLKIGKNARDFEASADADLAQRMDRASVTLGGDFARASEVLLAKAFLQDTRALYAERTHSYKRMAGPQEWMREDEEDLSEPLHCLFGVTPWPPGSFNSTNAFQSVYTIQCRNHVIAATTIAALLPFTPVVASPNDPAADDKNSGKLFYLAGKAQTKAYLVTTKNKELGVVFRGTSPENTAVAMVARQLGLKEPLCQAFVVPRPGGRAAVFQRGSALLLTPVATPLWHPLSSGAVSLSQSKFCVAMRTRKMPILRPSDCDILRPRDFLFLGELHLDCTLETRFGTIAAKPPAPRQLVEEIVSGKKKVVKRLRSLDDDSDGLPRAKRIKLLRETLDYRNFLRDIVVPMEKSEFVLFLIGKNDFIEVLSTRPNFDGLPLALVIACRDIALDLGFFGPTSTIAQCFDELLSKNNK